MHTQLEQIYKTYFHDVYRYALSLCQNESQAQDLVSETYLKAIEALPQDYTEVRAWLFRVCRNCFIDQQRKKKALEDSGVGACTEFPINRGGWCLHDAQTAGKG